jgi:hypothetical protein
MATDFGTDVSTYPDLDLSFAPISGQRVLAEAVMRRLETDRGTLVYDTDYGIGIRSWINESIGPSRIEELASLVTGECLSDERILSAEVAVSWVAATSSLRLTISLTPADGIAPPFQLLVAVSALSIDLLSLG